MNTILGELGKNSKFIELLKNVENKQSPIVISGLNDIGMIQLGTAINEFGKKPICILTYNEIQAKKIYEDIKYFTDKVVFFPKKEVVTYDYDSSDNDITAYGKVEESTEGTFKEYRLSNSLGDYKVSGNFTVNGNSTVVLNAEKKAEQEG